MIESVLQQGSTYAADIDFLFTTIFIIVGFFFLLAEGIFFYLMFRYRKKEGQRAEYIDDHHEGIERIISPVHKAIIVFDLFILAFAIQVWTDIKIDSPDPDATVLIIAQQWSWTFVHPGPDGQINTPDDVTANNELHVEIGKTYQYKLSSKDVLHDFSVPIFRLKQDAIPGRVITGWFKPTITGEYDIQCAEMCGIGHGIMGARIHIETPEAHAAWVTEHAPPGSIAPPAPQPVKVAATTATTGTR